MRSQNQFWTLQNVSRGRKMVPRVFKGSPKASRWSRRSKIDSRRAKMVSWRLQNRSRRVQNRSPEGPRRLLESSGRTPGTLEGSQSAPGSSWRTISINFGLILDQFWGHFGGRKLIKNALDFLTLFFSNVDSTNHEFQTL